MRWCCSLVFVTILVTVASLRASQVAQKTCKGGSKIALEISYDGSSAIFTYHLSEPKSFSAARVEVWDRPLRLSMIPVPVRKEGEIEWAPKKDPSDTPSELLIAVVDPTAIGRTISEVLIGMTRDAGGPSPSFPKQSFTLEEGGGSSDLTIQGTILGPTTEFSLREQEAPGTWIQRESLTGTLTDLQHTRVQIPSGYLSRPTILELGSMTVRVLSKDRPVLTGIDPTELSADSMADSAIIRLFGSGFDRESRALTAFEDDLPDFATKTLYISPTELQVKVDPSYLGLDSGSRSADRIQFRVRNGDDLHVSDPQELRVLPTADHPFRSKSVPVITSTSPYPVPLMDSRSPDFLAVTVYGDNFRKDEYVVLNNGDVRGTKLKMEYVSPQELHVLIPRELWKDHRMSYRLITQTAAGTCSTELWEEE